jgi:hypothetical protein
VLRQAVVPRFTAVLRRTKRPTIEASLPGGTAVRLVELRTTKLTATASRAAAVVPRFTAVLRRTKRPTVEASPPVGTYVRLVELRTTRPTHGRCRT